MEWENTELYIDLAPEVSHRITAREGVFTNRLKMRADEIVGMKELVASRDTYWKERVRKTVGKIEESARTQDTSYEYGEGTYEGMMHSIFILKDITNEDNLK